MIACWNGFIDAYDDELYVTMNPLVRSGLTATGITGAFTTFVAGNWHPLTLLSHMADVQLFGLNPFGHHLVSVLLHGAVVVLLFRLLLAYGFDSRPAFLAAALFAVHPLRVESVAWVAERKDVLSLFFGVAALLSYERYGRCPSVPRYCAVLFLFTLSLMSKPMLVTLPLLLMLRDLCPLPGDPGMPGHRRVRFAEKIPFLILSLLAAAVTLLAQKEGSALVAATVGERIVTALSAYGEYLRLSLLPVGLSFHYPLKPGMIGAGRAFVSLLLMIGMTAYVHRRNGKGGERFGWWWFLVTLVPVTGIVRFGGQFVADRYTYLPHIGLAILALSWLSARSSRHGRGKVLWGGGVLILLLSTMTIRQIGYWQSGETLFRRAIALDPGNWLAHANLGAALIKKDRYGEGFLELARGQLLRGETAAARETLNAASREGGVPPEELETVRRDIMEKLR